MVEFRVDDVVCGCNISAHINIDYDVEKLKDPASGRTSPALKIEVPIDERSRKVAGGECFANGSQSFNQSVHPAQLEIEQQEITSGVAQLNRIVVDGDSGVMEFTLRGDTDDWAHQVALASFNSIDVNYSALLTEAEVQRTWSNPEPICYLPINRSLSAEDVWQGSQTKVVQRPRTIDGYHPFLSIRALVEAIFAATGYELRSQFFDSDFFRSLYMSGDYAESESTVAHSRMGFRLEKLVDSQAAADSLGRVYITDNILVNSVGSVVDLESAEHRDGCYVNGGAVSMEAGRLTFMPLYSTTAGFEYKFRCEADYVIENRDKLMTFDQVYLADSQLAKFTVCNPFTDYREDDLLGGYNYRVVVFDHQQIQSYRLSKNGIVVSEPAVFASRSASVTMKCDTSGLILEVSYDGGSSYSLYRGDWAIYLGYVNEAGSIEMEVDLRGAPQALSPDNPKDFGYIYMQGAEPGMKLKLLSGTMLRPIFASYPGYGSTVRFRDVARHPIKQIDLLVALQQLFNLRFYTDSRAKVVYVEPIDQFYGGEVFDWRSRVVDNQGVEWADTAQWLHQRISLGYMPAQSYIAEFLDGDVDSYGRWSVDVESKIAIKGSQIDYNQIFYPLINSAQGVLEVGDRAASEGVDSLSFTPRIVQLLGERIDPDLGVVPYAAFHDAQSTLCFEDRDGAHGLNRYYVNELAQRERGRHLVLSIRLSAEELSSLLSPDSGCASVRSRYLLALNGESIEGVIERVEWYDAEQRVARITFLTN